MIITRVKAIWPEQNFFEIERKNIGNQYIFLHFLTPARVFVDGGFISAPADSCILHNKYSYQRFISENKTLVHNWCHIEGNLDPITEKYGFLYNRIYTVSNGDKITSIIQAIERENVQKNKYSSSLIDIMLEELIISVIHGFEAKERHNHINSALLKSFEDLRTEINLTYSDEWDVGKMAARVNLSTSRFHKIYKDIYGICPKKYLQQLRIEHAKILIGQNRYLIKEVAEMTGYKNQYHFIRQFKEYTGKTPGKYKK